MAKLGNGESARCKRLYEVIETGGAIFDYPGMLTLGIVTWDAKSAAYTLTVEATDAEVGGFSGFSCTFTGAGKIIKKVSHIRT